MANDKYFDQILMALDRELDGKKFEDCALDLLSKEIPGLAPIPGGQDSGMDGGVLDAEGEAYPLICTTSQSVIGNLTRSLKSYLEDGGKRRKCVLATSRRLTAPQINRLKKRAVELGFTLINVFEAQAIARKLYRDSKWAMDLLGLSGEPCVLSKIPLHSRSFSESLIGRSNELEWLEKQDQDTIIVGQPGTGKTHVAWHLAQKQNAFFLTAGGRDKLSAAIRDLQPEIIIVDDAHLREEWIASLLHLRAEFRATFRIVALTWPSGKTMLMGGLSLGTKNSRNLRLLTRDEIVEVINSLKVHGSPYIINEIVNQAEGKPGLAVTLTLACLKGDVEDMWKGNVLSRWVTESI